MVIELSTLHRPFLENHIGMKSDLFFEDATELLCNFSTPTRWTFSGLEKRDTASTTYSSSEYPSPLHHAHLAELEADVQLDSLGVVRHRLSAHHHHRHNVPIPQPPIVPARLSSFLHPLAHSPCLVRTYCCASSPRDLRLHNSSSLIHLCNPTKTNWFSQSVSFGRVLFS